MGEMYTVYVKADDVGRITAINSSDFLHDLAGWVEIDRGHSDKYHHAQSNYLPMTLADERGVYRYKLAGDTVVERTPEEMDADYVEPTPMPDLAAEVAELKEKNAQLEEALELLLSGATEEVVADE